jgi:GNAT superfamily N-acetyltransferase
VWWDGELTIVRRRATERDVAMLEEAHLMALGPVALVGYGWTKERLRAQFYAEVLLENCQVIEVRGAAGRWWVGVGGGEAGVARAPSAIEVGGRDAGYISVEDRRTCWYIDAFAILPNYQKRGVGSAALRSVLAAAPKPVRLSVLRTNRARTLYLRTGFRVIGQDRLRELMEWRVTSV